MMSNIGDRMKKYESLTHQYVSPNSYYVIRLDGKAFHTYTRGMNKPYDIDLMNKMDATASWLLQNIQTAKMAYTQSDEISIFCDDLDTHETEHWFGGRISKIESISASMCTYYFNNKTVPNIHKMGLFDSRVICIPNENEMANYLLWRQKDWERNSIQLLAQSLYSHRELHGKNHSQLHEMIYLKGCNWAHLSDRIKNGLLIHKHDGLILQ